MITLGIETSCDETAVAIIDGNKVLADITASSAAKHGEFGGIVPEIASRCHVEAILPCLDAALKKSGVPLSKVDLIAVTQGPGLMGSILVGVAAAKSLALALGKPLVPVDHVLAHAFSGMLGPDHVRGDTLANRTWSGVGFPFVALVVSGGHTLLVHWKRLGALSIVGRTFDDAAGEAFDKVAKILGLGYPGGPVIDRLSKGVDPSIYSFPRPWIKEAHYHFSFSGLKTAVLYKVGEMKARKGELDAKTKAEIASGFQEAVCDVLIEKSLKAARAFGVRTLVVGGGVSANSRLREALPAVAKARGMQLDVVFPTLALAVDNAVMIAALGASLWQTRSSSRKRGSKLGSRLRGNDLRFEAYSDFFSSKKGKSPLNQC